jgi:Beta protein
MTMAGVGSGFDQHHYVPILLSKRGERRAISELPLAVKAAMTPLFVIPPVDWDFEAEAPAKSVGSHIAKQPTDLKTAWGTRRAFVDLMFIEDGPLVNMQHPLVWLTEMANAIGLPLVPVTGVDRSTPYLQAVTDVIARDGRGMCLRLAPEEWPVGTRRLSDLDSLLVQLGIDPADTDLVLDVGDAVALSPGLTLTAVSAELAALPYINEWRSITVTASAFPKGAGAFAKGMNYVDRADWQLYQSLVALIGRAGRLPSFGDYVVAHPDPAVDVDPRMMQNSATLRYTAAQEWMFPKGDLFRGRGTSGQGAAAVPPIAALVANDPRFLGEGHCTTDQWISDVATGIESGANPEMWRRRGTRHHLQLVTEQLSTLSWP